MSHDERDWLHDVIVREATQTRTILREDIRRVEENAIESHHRLRNDLTVMGGQIVKSVTVLETRVKTLEDTRPPRRRDDPPSADYQSARKERSVTERDVRLVLATLGAAAAVLVAIWKVYPLLVKAVAL